MTPKVTVTFVVGLIYFMTPKGRRLIRGPHDLLYYPKGHGDVYGRLTYFMDPKRSLEVAVTLFMTPKFTMTFVVDFT